MSPSHFLSPARHSKRVDFPHPLGPVSAVRVPRCRSKDMFLKIACSGYENEIDFALSVTAPSSPVSFSSYNTDSSPKSFSCRSAREKKSRRGPSKMILPFSITTIRLAFMASSLSWVMCTTVCPFLFHWSMSCRISVRDDGSSMAVTSSRIRRSGKSARIPLNASRWVCPRESSNVRESALSARDTTERHSMVRSSGAPLFHS